MSLRERLLQLSPMRNFKTDLARWFTHRSSALMIFEESAFLAWLFRRARQARACAK
jgi:hypothetical protein